MSAEPVPEAAQPERLTEVLRRSGALKQARVSTVAVENARPTVISRVMRLRLGYEGDAPDAPTTLFLKTGLPERSDPDWISGRQEVAFYATVAPEVADGVLPRCWEAYWDPPTNGWHLLLEDLRDSHTLPTAWPLPPTFDQCKSILGAWAAFHAAWWDDPRLGATVGRCTSRTFGKSTRAVLRANSHSSPIARVTGCRARAATSLNACSLRALACGRATTLIAI